MVNRREGRGEEGRRSARSIVLDGEKRRTVAVLRAELSRCWNMLSWRAPSHLIPGAVRARQRHRLPTHSCPSRCDPALIQQGGPLFLPGVGASAQKPAPHTAAALTRHRQQLGVSAPDARQTTAIFNYPV